ncbi:MAG TPA: TolC family protein [Candidatus Polarisedimenticolia bacterium]|nr:TolC family protein [Candidatus Polarisedimenticolia bacterium]
MTRFGPILLLLLPALAFAGTEVPEAPPADLAALLHEAATGSPALRASAARLEAARAQPSQALAPPDPEASVTYLNDGVSRFTLGDSEFSALSLTWTQEVLHPGKLRRSGEAAGAGIAVAARDLDRARLEVLAAVKSGYADLYRLDEARAVLAETRAVLETLQEGARRRYEVGQGIQESVLKAQTEILRLEAESARLDQERTAAEARLNAAVGRAADTPIGAATGLPQAMLPDDADALAGAALDASPFVGRLEAEVRRGEAMVARARLDLKPDFTWSATYQYRGDLDPMVGGMFGLRLPIHRERRQAQALLQAQSELEAARHDLAAEKVKIPAAIRELVSRVERGDRLLVLIGQGLIPQAKSMLESALTSYGVGRIGFLDVLNDLTTLLRARLELASQRAERFQALAELEPLLGREVIRAAPDVADAGGLDVTPR